jgi:hypothetical protein
MAKIIDAECEMDDAPKLARKRKRKPKKTAVESDNEDNDFVGSSSDSDSTSQSEDSDGVEITNKEVSFSFTVLSHMRYKRCSSLRIVSHPKQSLRALKTRQNRKERGVPSRRSQRLQKLGQRNPARQPRPHMWPQKMPRRSAFPFFVIS